MPGELTALSQTPKLHLILVHKWHLTKKICAVLPQELVESTSNRREVTWEVTWANWRQMSNQVQQVLGGVRGFHQLCSKSWLCSVHAVQWTRSWWKVSSFGCTIWVEEPAKLFTVVSVVWIFDRYRTQTKLWARIGGTQTKGNVDVPDSLLTHSQEEAHAACCKGFPMKQNLWSVLRTRMSRCYLSTCIHSCQFLQSSSLERAANERKTQQV